MSLLSHSTWKSHNKEAFVWILFVLLSCAWTGLFLYNNTLFWFSLSTYEITYYLSTLSKWVSPLIILLFNHPKPTKGLDALSESRSDTRMSSATRCNHSSNALGFSSNLTMMMKQWWRWVEGLWLSSQGCYVNVNSQESELELAMRLK